MKITAVLLPLLLAGDVDVLRAMLEDAGRGADDGLRARLVTQAGSLEDPALRSRAAEAVDEIVSAAALRPRIAALTKELAGMGAKGVVEPAGPAWLRERVGAEPMRVFDRLSSVSLYLKVDAHAKDYQLNAKIGDAWVERLAGLPGLRALDLENTDVRGPGLAAVGTLGSLESLNLTLCPVTDPPFEALAGLSRLKVLGLASTRVDGTGLRHLQGLKFLENLNCHSAPVGDAGLEWIGKLASLVRLEIVHTRFTDAGAAHLKGLVNLERLQLGSRGATGASLAVLAALPRLKELDVHDGLLSREGWRHAAAAKGLRILRAYGGNGGDEGLREFTGHPELETLVLEGNGVTDRGLALLAGLPRLRKVTIKESKVSDAAVAALRASAPSLVIAR